MFSLCRVSVQGFVGVQDIKSWILRVLLDQIQQIIPCLKALDL